MEYMAKSDGADITVKYKRENEEHIATISPAWSDGDDMYKIGLVIRDSTAGIGTLTYLDPENGSFGGLGHGIQDADTGKLFDTEDGNVSDVMITGIVKGYKDKAGEIQGMFLEDAEEIGSLRKNTEYGIFGTIAKDSDFLNLKQYEQADASEIKEGAAYILTDLISGTPEMYDMQIERVYNSKVKNTKNMLIRITDERIINKTGGIIQGMGVIDNRDNTKKPENKGFSTVTLKLPSTLVSDPHRHIRIDDPL